MTQKNKHIPNSEIKKKNNPTTLQPIPILHFSPPKKRHPNPESPASFVRLYFKKTHVESQSGHGFSSSPHRVRNQVTAGLPKVAFNNCSMLSHNHDQATYLFCWGTSIFGGSRELWRLKKNEYIYILIIYIYIYGIHMRSLWIFFCKWGIEVKLCLMIFGDLNYFSCETIT